MRRRGYTLLEVMVAGAVGSLVLLSVARLMVAGGQMYLRGSTRADLQAAGLVAVSRMDRALRESAATLTTVSAAPQALACRSPRAPAFFVVFRDAAQRALIQKTWPRLKPDGTLADQETFRTTEAMAAGRGLSAAELAQICGSLNGTERAVAGDVLDFTVSLNAGTAMLRIQLEREVLGQAIRDTAGTTLLLRNKQ